MNLFNFLNLKNSKVISQDEKKMGKIKDIYFDDKDWASRYFIVDTGGILKSHQVLISPVFVSEFNEADKEVRIDLRSERIETAPSVSQEQPVSRQFEQQYYDFYGYPYYWTGQLPWGQSYFPVELSSQTKAEAYQKPAADPHLRSVSELMGYKINATDGSFGNIENFIFDNLTWMIRYVVIDTISFWPSKKVLIAPQWVSSVEWQDQSIHMDYSKDFIKSAPEYDMSGPPTRGYETSLYQHYRKPLYWEDFPDRFPDSAA